MRRHAHIFLWIVLLMGCSKGAGLEGKVLDVKSHPISGLKVLAKQVQPIKGYEQFEMRTSADGTFKFRGLYPSAEYVISVYENDCKTDAGANATAGPDGEISLLKKPLVIRFITCQSGVIKDTFTNLEWVTGPDRSTTFDQARTWCRGLSVEGGRWHMPSQEELRTLFIDAKAGKYGRPAFRLSGYGVWFEKEASPSQAWITYFEDVGYGYTSRTVNRDWDKCRVFAVRRVMK